MKAADFNFYLPEELIAYRPSKKRDGSRLLVLHKDGSFEHRMFPDIADYLKEGDLLILNNTKVFPARIFGTKESGGKIDILLVREAGDNRTWEIMCRGKYNGLVNIHSGIKAEIWTDNEHRTGSFLRFLNIEAADVKDFLWQHGHMPLPPYIKRMPDDKDKQRYQTVYAENEGSIAAPTAGLHFTEELLDKLGEKGVLIRKLTLHVGPGTFKSIKSEFLKDHRMDSEFFEINPELLDEIDRVKKSGNKIVGVGTTVTRALEGFMSGSYRNCSPQNSKNGRICGLTDIFIYPGYRFKAISSLITNFHLPNSTPLMLVSALAGFENISKSYSSAIADGYRFFSYGDAMLIL